MVIKVTNKDEKFYQYMGKIFGSRIVEKQTNDRIYDDNNKEWYLFVEDEKVKAFVSINKNVIKNVYTIKEKYLQEILERIKKENFIKKSIVTSYYKNIYEGCGYKIIERPNYKNFVTIYVENEEKEVVNQ